MSSSENLSEKILFGVQNMFKKRDYSELVQIESKIGYAYLNRENILLFIPPISNNSIEKIKNEQTHYLYFLMESHECKQAIVPYQAIAPQALENMKSHSAFKIELFEYQKLLFDPTNHEIVPLHVCLTKEEISKELPNMKVSDLPHILKTDAIIRFYGWEKGNVVRIHRKESLYYRLIV